MQTRACPSCSEIIPSDVDYCPFCGNSTRASIETEDDMALAAARAEREAVAPPAYESATGESDAADGRPAAKRSYWCMMCYSAEATVGDYCLDCKQKLDMRPEEWQSVRQNSAKTYYVIAALVAALLLALILLALARHSRHHARRSAAATAPRFAPAAVNRPPEVATLGRVVLTSPVAVPIIRQ